MVTIRLKMFSILREVSGARNLSLPLPDGSIVRDFLHELDTRYGITFRRKTDCDLSQSITAKFNVFLNNKLLVFPEELDVILREGDEIVILQPSSGG